MIYLKRFLKKTGNVHLILRKLITRSKIKKKTVEQNGNVTWQKKENLKNKEQVWFNRLLPKTINVFWKQKHDNNNKHTPYCTFGNFKKMICHSYWDFTRVYAKKSPKIIGKLNLRDISRVIYLFMRKYHEEKIYRYIDILTKKIVFLIHL